MMLPTKCDSSMTASGGRDREWSACLSPRVSRRKRSSSTPPRNVNVDSTRGVSRR